MKMSDEFDFQKKPKGYMSWTLCPSKMAAIRAKILTYEPMGKINLLKLLGQLQPIFSKMVLGCSPL